MDIEELLSDNSLPSTATVNDGPELTVQDQSILEKKESLLVLISCGKSKEFLGVSLKTEDLAKLSKEKIEKYYHRYESVLASKTNEALLNSFLKLITKGIGLVLKLDDEEKLHNDLKEDYIIQQELSLTAGYISMKCGKIMALASGVLHVANHTLGFKKDDCDETSQKEDQSTYGPKTASGKPDIAQIK